ncbi:preprotein translocase, SecG subunit [Thermoanaerobacter mathranii subsp. mathranii str. A3]|jgi:preprotein translocase subunit SecG|uniref:Protein-export membrane protein SecG n=2 Tax=Thermoanaerobacter TaxID=1754 RepID=A0ABT9M4C2_9THEO|nr:MULTISPECIES: preprotein translocase subunit SecG [Thermoanaerobacter]ADH61266.1 preprotein translocase, SecG subunit [Thermoanaerobacter mathranii subsp. mathranii str. A3]MDP9750922.1 preprotein translocase subunit SecG [Thermoanaerobacter pentosaceus]
MLKTVLMGIQILVSIFLIVVILLQKGRSAGISGVIAGGAETFFGKNKARTMEGTLEKLTTIAAVLFIILSMVLTVMMAK